MTEPDPAVITVLVADDHRIMRDGLRRILAGAGEIQVVAEADNGHDALALALRHRPRLALVDLSMPGLSGMDLVQRLRSELPSMAILVLTMHAEEQYALRAFRAGANGYLTKDSASDELLNAVRKVAAGRAYMSPDIAERIAGELNGMRSAPTHAQLTNREFEVLRLIIAGKRVTDIADTLHLSVKTISTHKSRIQEKLGLDSTAALVRYGLEQGLLDMGSGS